MGGGGGNQSSSSGDSLTQFSTTPFGQLFMSLFEGSEFDIGPGGAIQATGLPNVNPIFGADSFSSIGNLLTPNRPFQQDLGALGESSQELFGNIQELARTGGLDQLMAAENDVLFGSTIPGLKEEFGTQLGLGVGDSDFNAALARAVEGSANRAAGQSVQNQALFSQLGLGELPGLLGLEQGISDTATARSPGGTAINLFNTLAGIGSQQGFLGGQQSRERSSSFGWNAAVGGG